jgi:hypothetical protein
MIEIHELFQKEIDESLLIKIRDYNNINIKYLIIYYMAYKQTLKVEPSLEKDYFIKIDDSTNFKNILTNINKNNYTFLCLNDNFKKSDTSIKMKELLDTLFPTPSLFEHPKMSVKIENNI